MFQVTYIDCCCTIFPCEVQWFRILSSQSQHIHPPPSSRSGARMECSLTSWCLSPASPQTLEPHLQPPSAARYTVPAYPGKLFRQNRLYAITKARVYVLSRCRILRIFQLWFSGISRFRWSTQKSAKTTNGTITANCGFLKHSKVPGSGISVPTPHFAASLHVFQELQGVACNATYFA